MDESPISLFIPELKQQTAEWVYPNEPCPKKLRVSKSPRNATMLTLFWKQSGSVLVDFTEQNINAAYYQNLLRVVRSACRKARGYSVWLLQDNAPIHSALNSQVTLQELGYTVLEHPPYSPDLAPSDFHVFKRLKNDLRELQFNDVGSVKLHKYFEKLREKILNEGFQNLVHCWVKCVGYDGSYIECYYVDSLLSVGTLFSSLKRI